MVASSDPGFGFVLHDVARLLRKRFEQQGRPFGLTRAQWQVLAWLSRHEGINQSRLAELMDLEPVTLGRIVDRMQEGGLVERRSDPADRRAHRLFVMPRARPLLEHGRRLGAAVLDEAFAGFTPQQREVLLDLLLLVRSNLSPGRRDDETSVKRRSTSLETVS